MNTGTITCLLVDDEHSSRAVLRTLIEKHCPGIKIVGEASSANEAIRAIEMHRPQLLFLDVQMPGKNSFELLREFSEIDFDVIFVSGFDEYALQAFDFNAIDYILKPVDYRKLVSAVERAKERISLKSIQSQNVLHFVHTLDEKSELVKKVSLHHNDKVVLIDISSITFIEAARGYCDIYTSDNQKYISSKPLKDYEMLLSRFPSFMRVNKSILINVSHIHSYSKGTSCFVTLNNEKVVEISRRKKTEIIEMLKKL
jgi:two-component system LytT family response regulator